MEEQYKSDLKDIKDMMIRSSRFISLNGASGISVGIIACIGAYLAHYFIYDKLDNLDIRVIDVSKELLNKMVLIASGTLVLAVLAAIFFTTRESRKKGQKTWDVQTKRLVINLSIPLVTGGILCLFFLLKGYLSLLAPFTLIFHGLALVNASQYTLKEIRGLGILMIVIGILALIFIGQSLMLWAIGFGLLHILYGLMMKWKIKS